MMCACHAVPLSGAPEHVHRVGKTGVPDPISQDASHRHPEAAERPRLVVGRMIKSARPSKDDRPGPSPVEAPPAEEAGVAPQDDGSAVVRANVGTIHRASGSGLSCIFPTLLVVPVPPSM